MEGTMKIGLALVCMVGSFIAGTKVQRHMDIAYLKGVSAVLDAVKEKIDDMDDEKAEEESQ